MKIKYRRTQQVRSKFNRSLVRSQLSPQTNTIKDERNSNTTQFNYYWDNTYISVNNKYFRISTTKQQVYSKDQ